MNKYEDILKKQSDLASRLYYCSNSPDGRKMRRWIEKQLRQLDKELAKPIK